MRSDLIIDGVVFGAATVGGDDATATVLKMYRSLDREDINLILLSGCIISLYNLIDADKVASLSGLPVLCLTYRESRGIEGAIAHHFRESGQVKEKKLRSYRNLGSRTKVSLQTGSTVYVRSSGISVADAKKVLDTFTLQGGVAEPVRVARLIAHARRRAARM